MHEKDQKNLTLTVEEFQQDYLTGFSTAVAMMKKFAVFGNNFQNTD